MSRLYFDLAETIRIAEAAQSATAHRQSFVDNMDGTKTPPSLVFVKDDGVYLMSNADPRPDGDLIYAHAYSADGLHLVGQAPKSAWDAIWDTARDICGGDDFAEYFAVDELLPFLRETRSQGHTHFIIDVSPETVDLFTERASA